MEGFIANEKIKPKTPQNEASSCLYADRFSLMYESSFSCTERCWAAEYCSAATVHMVMCPEAFLMYVRTYIYIDIYIGIHIQLLGNAVYRNVHDIILCARYHFSREKIMLILTCVKRGKGSDVNGCNMNEMNLIFFQVFFFLLLFPLFLSSSFLHMPVWFPAIYYFWILSEHYMSFT